MVAGLDIERKKERGNEMPERQVYGCYIDIPPCVMAFLPAVLTFSDDAHPCFPMMLMSFGECSCPSMILMSSDDAHTLRWMLMSSDDFTVTTSIQFS